MKKTLKYVFAALAATALVANAELINLTDPSLEAAFGGTTGTAESGWFTFGNATAAVDIDTGYASVISNNDGPNAAFATQVNENDGGSIYQTVELDAGKTYRLSAGVAQNWYPKNDGKYALVFFTSTFSSLEAETTGVAPAFSGAFVDDYVEFSPTATGLFNVGLRNRGYVPGTGAETNESTIFFDNVRLEVVPEPATLGLVAVFGGAVLFIRRKLTI